MALSRSSKVIFTVIIALLLAIGFTLVLQDAEDQKVEEMARSYLERGNMEYLGEVEMTREQYLYRWPDDLDNYPFSDPSITEYRFFKTRVPNFGVETILPLYKSPDDGSWHPVW